MFEGGPRSKTLVLASVDGSELGEVGATRAVAELPTPDLVDAVIVISDLGAHTSDGPLLRPGRTTPPCRHRASAHRRRTRCARSSVARPEAAARSASSPGCRSRSASAPRACCSRGLRRRADLRQRRAAADGNGPSRRRRRTGSAARPRDAAHGHRARRAAPRSTVPRATSRRSARCCPAGCCRCWPAAAAAGAGGLRGRVRPSAPPPGGRAQVAALAGAWVAPFLAALALAQFLALVGATPHRLPRRCRRTCCP